MIQKNHNTDIIVVFVLAISYGYMRRYMKQLNFKVILGGVLPVLVVFVAAMFWTKEPQKPQEITSPNNNDTTSTTATNVQLTQPQIEGVKVPDGWYSNQTYGIDHEMTVLSRTKELPKTLDVEQIGISDMTTSLSPEDFISRQGLVGGGLDSPNAGWNWGIYKGHKTFSMTVSANGTSHWFVYIFGGQRVQEFTLTSNDKTNLNLEKDREDFWEVITYYAQNPSFEKLSRTETQQNCATVHLTEDQKSNMQAEPETGYVAVNFTQDNKRKYAFFNYNDDLSQCTPNVKTLLENVKNSAEKLSQ